MMSRLYSKGAVSDLILMDKISDEEINSNLKRRFNHDDIYTYIGPVLLSVNPFKMISGLYGDGVIRSYIGRFLHERPPHVYALAHDAYRTLKYDKENQCIIISGESGAGKTEASKFILHFISAVSRSDRSGKIKKVKEKILSSNPVLESFGNAKTLRNDNSSRFGKYMTLMFDHSANPVGGTVQNYLLEKSRVVNTAMGERNFHIFYRLKAGLSKQDQNTFKLSQPLTNFKYLSKSDCFEVPRMNDKEEFQDMLSGLESLGTSPEEISEIFSTVSAILWIGQIEFRRVEGKKTDVEIVDPSPVQAVAELIRCDYKALTQALMTREYAAGNAQSVAANLSLEQAYYTRDALAKTIYFRLFDFIVGLVNKAMHISNTTDSLNESNLCTMGVLDIYGFEIFENNSFEQLCINFVNEKLQQIFIENTLRAEQEEYRVEKIEWTPVEFFNNKIVCELFESRPKGIFNYLDEACIVPQGSDSSFLQTLDEQLSSHPHYSKPNDRDSKNIAFTVKHYAGDVTYKKHGFIEKNKDLVWFDLLQMGESSQMSIFKTMFPAGDANRMKNSKKRPLTAAAQFKTQVTALMKQLSSSTPHYIRCIKPNDNKQSGVFNDKRVLHQVRYLGLLENVRVRRAGFAFRQDFEGFVGRYKLICESSWPTYSIDSIAGCELICAEMNLKSGSDYQIGISKIFIRKPASLYMLEELREKSIDEIVKRVGENKIMFADSIQKINRKNICQLRYLVVTDKSLFFMKKDKVGSYQQQRQIKIEKVTGISMSPFKDHWVVIHVQEEYDYVIMSERKKELLACLSEVMDIAGYSLNVNHGKSLVYKLKNKTDRFIEFTEDHSISGFSWEVSKKDKNKIDVTVGNMVFNTQDATSPRGHGNVGERAYAY